MQNHPELPQWVACARCTILNQHAVYLARWHNCPKCSDRVCAWNSAVAPRGHMGRKTHEQGVKQVLHVIPDQYEGQNFKRTCLNTNSDFVSFKQTIASLRQGWGMQKVSFASCNTCCKYGWHGMANAMGRYARDFGSTTSIPYFWPNVRLQTQ